MGTMRTGWGVTLGLALLLSSAMVGWAPREEEGERVLTADDLKVLKWRSVGFRVARSLPSGNGDDP